MFLGTHFPRLDEKGRLVLPAKFRDALAQGVVLTKGRDRSLIVWPAAAFQDFAAGLDDSQSLAYQRVMFSGASDEVPDRQGRITVPAALREYAGLERDVVVVGTNRTAEIWDRQAWESWIAGQDEAYSGEVTS